MLTRLCDCICIFLCICICRPNQHQDHLAARGHLASVGTVARQTERRRIIETAIIQLLIVSHKSLVFSIKLIPLITCIQALSVHKLFHLIKVCLRKILLTLCSFDWEMCGSLKSSIVVRPKHLLEVSPQQSWLG